MAVRLIKARLLYGGSSRQLRRARRLFVYMNFDALMDADNWEGLAEKLQARGLYSQSTPVANIRFSVARYLFQAHRRANPQAWDDGFGWYRWLELHPWIYWFERGQSVGIGVRK